MHRMHRAVSILPILVLALAACAAPGTGSGGTSETTDAGSTESAEAGASASAPAASASQDDGGDDAEGVQRVDITALAGDPSAVEGQEVALLARVDEVLIENVAFLTSPSGTEEGQFPVILATDAQVDKEISQASVLWLEGTVAALTPEDLEAAGVDAAIDLGGFDGEFAFVATSVQDPLERGDEG